MRPDVRYARNGDVALAYQVIGDGPQDTLLVSGFLSNIEYAWMYPSLARFLTRLSGFSRLIMMDRRGSGLSDATSPGGRAGSSAPQATVCWRCSTGRPPP
jgi:hypothetical protein